MAKQFNANTFDAEALRDFLITQLAKHESAETYTDDDEKRNQGRVGMLEDLIHAVEIGTFQKEE